MLGKKQKWGRQNRIMLRDGREDDTQNNKNTNKKGNKNKGKNYKTIKNT